MKILDWERKRMNNIRIRIEIYPKETIISGIRIRLPKSYIKRLAKHDSVCPQVFIKSENLKKEFGLEQIIIAIDNDLFISKKDKCRETKSAHGERKIEVDMEGNLDSYLEN